MKKKEVSDSSSFPLVTIGVLTYGDFPNLAKRAIDSILRSCDRSLYRLVVGGNAVGRTTLRYLTELYEEGKIDCLYLSHSNIHKCPMMRIMFENLTTDYFWWFDDDSYITEPNALERWLEHAQKAPESTVHWGHRFFFNEDSNFNLGTDVVKFVKDASWYRGKEPPSRKPGGKGEFNFRGQNMGDSRWFFITGGCWLIRTKAIHELDWPDRRLIKRNDGMFLYRSDDVLLSEAIRQYGWNDDDIGPLGVAINQEIRRGLEEDHAMVERQMEKSNS